VYSNKGTVFYRRKTEISRNRKRVALIHDDKGSICVTALKALALAWGMYGDDVEIPSDIRDMSDLHAHHRDGDISNDTASNALILPRTDHRDEHAGSDARRGVGLTLAGLDGVFSEHFPSINAAARFLGWSHFFNVKIQRHKERNESAPLVVVSKRGDHAGLKFTVVLDTLDTLSEEEWKIFPYAYYGLSVRGNGRCRVFISNLGRVKHTFKTGSWIEDFKHCYQATIIVSDKYFMLGKVMLYLFKHRHVVDKMSRTGMEFDELQCDHIDAKHPVNVISNLQLLTPTENCRKQARAKPVFVCKKSETLDTDVDGDHFYPCIAAAAEALSVSDSTIRFVAKGITKHSRTIKARYVSDCVDDNN